MSRAAAAPDCSAPSIYPKKPGDACSPAKVPREGTRVTRAYQLARWIDGTTVLWLGRRTTTGRGEGSSGLRYDTTEP